MWDIRKIKGQYCIIKQDTNEQVACHTTRGAAVDQLRLLYSHEADKAYGKSSFHMGMASLESVVEHLKLALESNEVDEVKMHVKEALNAVDDLEDIPSKDDYEDKDFPGHDWPDYEYSVEEYAALQASGEGVKEFQWQGPIAFEGILTGDKRFFKPGSIEWDEANLPIPFRWQKQSVPGHTGAVPIGRVDHIERKIDGTIYAYGVIIPSLNEEAAEYLRLIESGVASGVSVDGDSAIFDTEEMSDGTTRVGFTQMRLRSLTAVDIPAFNEAQVDLVEDKEELSREKPKKKMGWMYHITAAAGAPIKPPVEWFQDPELEEPTPITITQHGEVFGHLALFGTCHIGLPGCTTPPKGSSYTYFHTGELETETGELVDIGHLTFRVGHADVKASARAAADHYMSHYDNVNTVAADVRVGEDEFGVWIAGALRPHLTDEDVRAFRAAPLSGDWRRIAGKLELVGALCVNVPGFPVPRTRTLVASGETETFITFQAPEVFDDYEDSLRIDKKNQLWEKISGREL